MWCPYGHLRPTRIRDLTRSPTRYEALLVRDLTRHDNTWSAPWGSSPKSRVSADFALFIHFERIVFPVLLEDGI